MRRIKVGVIGVGHLGKYHAEKFARMEEAELCGVVDIREERARKIAEKYHTTWFTDFRRLLPEVEALSIVTPTVTHFEIARECLLAGKHLFVEKPLTDRLETAEELVALAETRGIVLQVGHIERFQPPVKRLLSEVKRPLFIEAHRLSSFKERALDVDVILDLMIHDLDLVLALNPKVKLKALLSAGAPVLSDKIDIASVRLVFENGCSANLTASRVSLTPQRRFRVFEKGAYFSADNLTGKYFEVRLGEDKKFIPQEESFPSADPLWEELQAFVRTVAEGGSPPVSGREALSVLRLAFRIKGDIEANLSQFLNG